MIAWSEFPDSVYIFVYRCISEYPLQRDRVCGANHSAAGLTSVVILSRWDSESLEQSLPRRYIKQEPIIPFAESLPTTDINNHSALFNLRE